mgnify:CR=1 FL=1|tara:strand:- start:150 stop:563 length:414 start_codon:yes stop_codon:yes gene_type:complete
MSKTLILYPFISMILLTLFLYVQNYLVNRRAIKNGIVKFSYLKDYKGDVPSYITISRQTLKNQLELPIFFYLLILMALIFDKVALVDLILSWVFVISRYIHCYIRLGYHNIIHRAYIFEVGMFALVIWWIIFLYNIL